MSTSLAHRLATLPTNERAEILSAISEKEAAFYLYDWEGVWARPEQLPPAGNWTIWLLLAGRGFGKTLTGSQWIRARVDSGVAQRIALVAPTSADVRDIVAEGTSGIMSVFPPHQRPVYEPSKRRIKIGRAHV